MNFFELHFQTKKQKKGKKMTSVKRLFFSLVLILLAANISLAQVNRNYDGTKPEVMKGAKNFVFLYTPFQSNLMSAPAGAFSVGDSTSLGEVNLFGIGFRYFVSNDISLTGGINFGSETVNFPVAGSTSKHELTTFGISIDGDYHLPALYSVSPYVGININFGTATDKDTFMGTTIEDKGSSFGAGANFGFDWYFTEGLSLGGKYTLGFRSLTAPERTQTGGVNPGTTTGADGNTFGTGIMSVILNVHL